MAKINPEPIARRWNGPVIVACPGPSLNEAVAAQCTLPTVAVNDAYKLLPHAEVLYAADLRWWELHHGCPKFRGEKFVPASTMVKQNPCTARGYGLRVVEGASHPLFSFDPARIHYGVLGTGANSGFQAINLALLLGGNPVILVGMDMREVDGKKHFFGDHPKRLMQRQHFQGWIKNLIGAASQLPPHIKVINATPGSALRCFEHMTLAQAKETGNGAAASRAA